MVIPTSWYFSMSRISLRKNGQLAKHQFSKERMKQAIETFGINTLDEHGCGVIHHLQHMTDNQIDLVMQYKPSFLDRGICPYWPGHSNKRRVELLKKILEHDTEHVYNTHWFRFGDCVYKNLFTFINSFFNEQYVREYYDRNTLNVRFVEYTLLSNHMNKWVSLFDLMLDHVDLSDKKRRFY